MSFFFHKFNNICRQWRSAACILAACALLGAGCTTTTTQSFQRTKNSNVEASYVATDADFGKYRQLRGEDMGIFFPESSPIPEEDLQRIRQIFRDAFFGELQGYEIVESTGPQVMTVQASLIDLREADLSDVPDMRPGLDDVARRAGLHDGNARFRHRPCPGAGSRQHLESENRCRRRRIHGLERRADSSTILGIVIPSIPGSKSQSGN